MLVKVRVKPACEACRSEGRLLIGWSEVMAKNARGNLIVIVPLAAIVLGLAVWQAVEWVYARTAMDGTVWELTTVLLSIAGVAYIIRRLPTRAVMCPKCRRVVRFGFGRRVPASWVEIIGPTLSCVRCGYSLVGLQEPRCPECGLEFPTSWLAGTKLGTSDVAFEVELITRDDSPGEG